MTYTEYLDKMGMTNKEVIELLHPHFPKFTKTQCSMISHPEKYGVQLTAEARAKLPQPQKKPKPKRTKPNRLVVYLDDEQYERILEAKGDSSTQDYLEKIIQGEFKTK